MTKYTSRNASNYFPLPNEIFNLGLSSGEISVYSYLIRCEDRETFQCHPSYAAIGKAVKLSRNTVQKYVKSLEEKGLIITQPTSVVTRLGIKRNGNLKYTILPIEGAKQSYYERQVEENEVKLLQEKFKNLITK